jgi:hypothetical protein
MRPCNQPQMFNPISWTCFIQLLWTSSPQCHGALMYWNHNLYLTVRSTSSSSSGRTVSRKLRHYSDVRLIGNRQRPTTMSPTILAQTLMLKQTWYPCPPITWRLCHALRRLLCMLNTSTHRICFACPQSSSLVYWCHTYSQNSICRGRLTIALWMQRIAIKSFLNPMLGKSHFHHNASISPKLQLWPLLG